MNKFLKTLIIIIICIAVISAGAYTVTLISGKNSFAFLKKLKVTFNQKELEEEVLNESFYVTFTNVEINSNAAKIEVESTTDSKASVIIYSEGNDNKAYIENGTLKVETKIKECKFFCVNRKVSKIVVKIPYYFSNTINIESNFGDINVGNFEEATLNVSLNAGNVVISSINEANITNNYGDVEVMGTVKKLSITEDCGDVSVSTAFDAEITNHLGNIEIKEITNYINITEDCGDIKIDKLHITKDSRIHDSMGDVRIAYAKGMDIVAKTSLGAKSIKTIGANSDIVLTITNSLGDILVNY